jgi:beta-glucosidase/6-phospho-beta-glucosidase/beta-galactosidase
MICCSVLHTESESSCGNPVKSDTSGRFGPSNQVCAGVDIHFVTGHEKDLDMIAAAGFKFVRMDLLWQATEPAKGTYNWVSYDELTANLEKRGIRAILILCYSNSLYEKPVDTKDPLTKEAIMTVIRSVHGQSINPILS